MSRRVILSILSFFAISVFSQDAVGISDGSITEQNDSLHQQSTEKPAEQVVVDCFPPCRNGFVCNKGQCIELCNPPCPSGTRCNGNGECIVVKSKKHKSNKSVLKVRVVPSGSEVCIDDDCVSVDTSARFNLPDEDDHEIIIKSPGFFPQREKVTVDKGDVEELDIRLKQMKYHGSFGFSLTSPIPVDGDPYIGFSFETGVALPKHRMGGVFNVAFRPHSDSTDYAPDHNRYIGGGFVYHFTGIGNNFKFIPGVAFGMWTFRDYYFLVTRSSTSINRRTTSSSYDADLKYRSYSNYLNPQFALVWGAMKKVSFKYQMGVWIGQKIFMDMANFGILLTL